MTFLEDLHKCCVMKCALGDTSPLPVLKSFSRYYGVDLQDLTKMNIPVYCHAGTPGHFIYWKDVFEVIEEKHINISFSETDYLLVTAAEAKFVFVRYKNDLDWLYLCRNKIIKASNPLDVFRKEKVDLFCRPTKVRVWS